MKQLFNLIAVAIALFVGNYAQAYTTVEIEMANKADAPTFQALLTRPIGNDGFGAFINVNASENWNQVYGGLTYAPNQHIQVGYGKGFESFGTHERTGAFIWSGYGRVSGCLAVEDGASGPWHRLTVDYAVTDELSLGYINKAFAGQGPTLTYTLDKGTRVRFSSYDGDISATLMLAF